MCVCGRGVGGGGGVSSRQAGEAGRHDFCDNVQILKAQKSRRPSAFPKPTKSVSIDPPGPLYNSAHLSSPNRPTTQTNSTNWSCTAVNKSPFSSHSANHFFRLVWMKYCRDLKSSVKSGAPRPWISGQLAVTVSAPWI